MSRGSIQHRPDRPKPYRARYRITDGSERSESFRRKTDAQAWLLEQTSNLQRGEWTDPRRGRTTFSEQLDKYVGAQRHLAPSTRASRDSLLRNHVVPGFGPQPLVSIGHSDIQAFISALEAKGLSRSTIRQAYLIVAGVFESAVDDGVMPRSPCRKIRLPKETKPEHRYLTASQVDELVTATTERFRVLVLAGAYTGLRLGELSALRVSDLDLLRRTFTVRRSLTEVRGTVVIGDPKTAAGRRQVSLPSFLCDELGRHIAECPPGTEGLVFTDPEGGPMRRTNWRRRVWLPAVEESVGQPMRFHDLRHTHVAMLIAQGAHPKTIQARLGHSSIKTTLDTYGHLFEGLDAAAADRLDETWIEARAAQAGPKRTSAEVISLPG